VDARDGAGFHRRRAARDARRLCLHGRNYALALREADRAVALSPGYAAAHIWRGEVLAVLGRLDESIEEMQRAIALDPMTPFPRFFVARVRELKGDFAAAERDYQAARELMPGYTGAGSYARLLLRMGRADEALQVARETVAADASVTNIVTLGVVQALTGRREEALASAAQARTMAAERWISPLEFAAMEAALGNRETAVRHLREAIEARDFRAPMLGVQPEIEFDVLKNDAGFQELIASVRAKP
jgi:tetratricopeptide (TPR) repeat protein